MVSKIRDMSVRRESINYVGPVGSHVPGFRFGFHVIIEGKEMWFGADTEAEAQLFQQDFVNTMV